MVSRERKMMMLMLSRKMLVLRRRMLRRKTDEARTQTYTLREPEQSMHFNMSQEPHHTEIYR